MIDTFTKSQIKRVTIFIDFGQRCHDKLDGPTNLRGKTQDYNPEKNNNFNSKVSYFIIKSNS